MVLFLKSTVLGGDPIMHFVGGDPMTVTSSVCLGSGNNDNDNPLTVSVPGQEENLSHPGEISRLVTEQKVRSTGFPYMVLASCMILGSPWLPEPTLVVPSVALVSRQTKPTDKQRTQQSRGTGWQLEHETIPAPATSPGIGASGQHIWAERVLDTVGGLRESLDLTLQGERDNSEHCPVWLVSALL